MTTLIFWDEAKSLRSEKSGNIGGTLSKFNLFMALSNLMTANNAGAL
jgi:hypothetical protein